MQRLLGFSLTLALALGVATAAHADEPRKAAGEHYQRGLELADRGDYQTALDEFERAYALSPNFAVLYNIGQADVELGRPQKAIDALERYLDDGKDKVPRARRAEVERQLEQLRSSFAELSVTTVPSGADVAVDGAEIGATPLAKPVTLTAGSHVVSASRSGAASETRVVVVHEGQKTELRLELPDLPPPVAPNGPNPEQTAIKAAETKLLVPSVVASGGAADTARASAPFPTGYVLIGAGVVLGGATVAHYVWNHGRVEEYRANEAALETDTSPGRSERQVENNELASSIQHASVVTVVLGVASGALVAAGTVLVVMDHTSRKEQAAAPHFELPNVGVARDSFRVSWGGTW